MTIYQVLVVVIVCEVLGIASMVLGLGLERLWLRIVGWVLLTPVVLFLLAFIGWALVTLWTHT